MMPPTFGELTTRNHDATVGLPDQTGPIVSPRNRLSPDLEIGVRGSEIASQPLGRTTSISLSSSARQSVSEDVIAKALRLHEESQWEHAATHYAKAIDECESGCIDADWKTVARLHNNFAMVLRELDRAGDAEDHYIRALISYDAVPQADVAEEISSLLGNLAYLHFDCGRYDDSLKVQHRALEVSRAHLMSDIVTLGKNERRTGIFAFFANQPKVSRQHLEQALALAVKAGNHGSPSHVELLVNLAAVQLRLENYEEALRLSNQASEMLVQSNHTDELMLAAVLNNIGCLQLRQKNPAAALEALNCSLRILKSHAVSDDTARAEVFHNLALAHDSMGNGTSAAVCRRFAVDLFSSISEDCRAKLEIAGARNQAVPSSAGRPVMNSLDQAFIRQPVRISHSGSSGVFALPMKTETIEWDL